MVAGAALVAAVDGVVAEVVLAPPNPGNSDPPAGAAAGVED